MKMDSDDSASHVSVVLVDDDSVFAREMRETLARCFAATGEKHSFAVCPDAEAFWEAYDSLRPDIVFIDIQLPKENGLETAKKLYRMDKRPVIVFVTSSPDFAAQGYGVNALGYIVKPVTDRALADILQAAEERLRPPACPTLAVRDENGIRILRLDRVTHMESRNRRVLFHCDGETVLCVASLAGFQPRLPPSFLQIHKSFIINLDRALALRTAGVLLDDGTEAPISRRYRKETAEAFFARLSGEIPGAGSGR